MRTLALRPLTAAVLIAALVTALTACGGGGGGGGGDNFSSGGTNRTALLSWVAPTQNADNTPLTDLAGYRVYVGQQSGSYGNSYTIADPLATTHTVTALASGTHYFIVKAFDASGNESDASDEVSKTIP